VCHVASKSLKDETKRGLGFRLGPKNDRLSECRQLGGNVERLTLSVTDEVSAESFRCRITLAQNGKEIAPTIRLLQAR